MGECLEIWGDGGTDRDYIYIDDAVLGLIAAMAALSHGFDGLDPIFNIGSGGRGVSLLELLFLLMHILDKPIEVYYNPARDFDVQANILDIRRATSWAGTQRQVLIRDSQHIFASLSSN